MHGLTGSSYLRSHLKVCGPQLSGIFDCYVPFGRFDLLLGGIFYVEEYMCPRPGPCQVVEKDRHPGNPLVAKLLFVLD